MSPPVQPVPDTAALYTGGGAPGQSLLDPAQPVAHPPNQVLANAHLLRAQHGWSQADVDGYVQEQTGLPSMKALAEQIAAPSPGEDSPYHLTNSPTANAIFGTVAKFGQGASSNFADRLSGAVDALIAGIKQGQIPTDLASATAIAAQHPTEYQTGRDQARNYYQATQAAIPAASTIANGVGNLASSVIGGSLLNAPATVLGAAGQGALLGGGSSALATAGNQPDLTDPSALFASLKSGGIGAGMGGILGGAGQFALQRLMGRAGPLLTRGIEESGGPHALRQAATAQEAAGRGAEMVPADLSPTLQGYANSAVNAASPGVRAPLQDAILARNAGQPQRLAEDLRDLFGTELNGPARQAELQQMVRSIENDPETGYQALNDAIGPIQDPRLMEFLGRPGVKAAYQRAVDNLATTGETSIGPDFQTLNATRKTLANQADAAFRAGNGDQGAAFSHAANELRGILADNVPAFEDLQGRVANVKSMLDAANDAGDVLQNETLHGLADKVNGLSGDALTEFRRGLASKLYDQLASMRTGRGIASTLLTDPGLQAKLEVAFGDQSTFQRFLDRVSAEKAMSGTGAIFGNSQTAQRMAGASDMTSNLPVSGGLSIHEGGLRPYLFSHLPRGSATVTANPMAQALLTPQSLDQFLQTVQRLNARGTLPRQILSSLPGGVASVATQP